VQFSGLAIVEPPSKKQKTSNDSNVKEAKASTSSSNNFKTVANDYQAKDTVDVKINDDLADVGNGLFVILLYCVIKANDFIPISIHDCISCLHLSSLEHSTCFNLFNSLVTLEAALTIVSC
jgi:hypothetical protein